MSNREKILSHLLSDEDRLIAAQALDKVESVIRGEEIAYTNFLDPHQQEIVEPLIDQIPEVKYQMVGGFDQAQRRRLVIISEYMLWEVVHLPIVYLEISGNFEFQQVSHRDYLGSLMGLGIKREMLGDILPLSEGGCQLVAAAEVRDVVCLNLDKVHQVSVQVREINEDELKLPEEKIKIISSTVASLRLDAVASVGFSNSRSKMAKDIKAERVKVNYVTITDPAKGVKPEDIISYKGRGRVEIQAIEGETRKGRTKLTLKRFL